jgi:hypothetical protein
LTAFSQAAPGNKRPKEGRILKKGAFFFALKGGAYQPGATPWVNNKRIFSPERALHRFVSFNVSPFQGLNHCYVFTQGVALGWYALPFQG